MLDHSLLEKYLVTHTSKVPEHHWVNFLGVKTDTRLFPGKEALAGSVITSRPVPDDGVYGGSAEYLALLTAVDDRLKAGANSFTAVELGAGWGPWVSAAGVVCDRAGISRINLVAVEADREKYNAMERHFEVNGLNRGVKSRLIKGAAWYEDTTLEFPKNLPLDDWGAGPGKGDMDYRGGSYEMEQIPAFSLDTICEGLDTVDFAHWDIQGAERLVAIWSAALLQQKFRYIFIGTHSRKIEGDLLEFFRSIDWEVIYHSPCDYTYDRTKPTLEGMTSSDGSMFVRNPHMS